MDPVTPFPASRLLTTLALVRNCSISVSGGATCMAAPGAEAGSSTVWGEADGTPSVRSMARAANPTVGPDAARTLVIIRDLLAAWKGGLSLRAVPNASARRRLEQELHSRGGLRRGFHTCCGRQSAGVSRCIEIYDEVRFLHG